MLFFICLNLFKNLRVKNGLTQEKLAEMIGISQRSLSGIEIGENFLTADTLDKILISLDVTPDELFALEHLKPTSELVKELVYEIKSVKDEEKIKILYKIVKAVLRN